MGFYNVEGNLTNDFDLGYTFDASGKNIRAEGDLATHMNVQLPPQYQAVVWRHTDPVTGTFGVSGSTYGYATGFQPDPVGVDLGFSDPYLDPPESQPLKDLVSLVGGSGSDRCTLDGVGIECAIVDRLLGTGSVAQCPNNDCSARSVYNPATEQREWRFFRAFADGYQGLLDPHTHADL